MENVFYGLKDFAEKLMKSFKGEIKEEARNQMPEVGKYLAQNIYGGFAKENKYVIEAFNAMLEKIEYQRDMDIIDEAEYYRQMEALRDQYFSIGSKSWVKYTEKIYSYQKKALADEMKTISKLYDSIADYAVDKLDEVIKKQQATAERLTDIGTLFKTNTVIMNGKTDVYYTLGNLEHDIEIIRRYGENIAKIQERAASLGVNNEEIEGILDEIKEFDAEKGYSFMQALLTSTDNEFVSFAHNLQLKKNLSEGVSTRLFESEFSQSWEDAVSNMNMALEKVGYEIPEGFYISGSISAQKFGAAFIEELDMQLSAIRERVDEFNAGLKIDIASSDVGNTYNTTNTSYNIQSSDSLDTVEQIKRYEAVKRLSGVN